ncbi:MAG: hypothetical protein AAGB51_15100 [Planctomycetota bacterium]
MARKRYSPDYDLDHDGWVTWSDHALALADQHALPLADGWSSDVSSNAFRATGQQIVLLRRQLFLRHCTKLQPCRNHRYTAIAGRGGKHAMGVGHGPHEDLNGA